MFTIYMANSRENMKEDSLESSQEYEEVDYSDDKLYCILRALFEDDDGLNVCDHLKALVNAVNDNTRMMKAILTRDIHNTGPPS